MRLRRPGSPPKRREPWIPRSPAEARAAGREADLADADLAELLDATNAKRAARGRAPLGRDDVEARLRADGVAAARRAAERAAAEAADADPATPPDGDRPTRRDPSCWDAI